MIEIEVNVDSGGPVFNGVAYEETERFMQHVQDTLGDMGVSMIKAYLPTQYKYLGHHGGTPQYNPIPRNAGFLVNQIFTERASPEQVLVTETPVVYGPWIEGVAYGNWIIYHTHRDPPPRRFPGYHAFRKTGESLDAMSGPIAVRELPPFLAAMNG